MPLIISLRRVFLSKRNEAVLEADDGMERPGELPRDARMASCTPESTVNTTEVKVARRSCLAVTFNTFYPVG